MAAVTMITGKIGKEFYITKGVLQADALAVFFYHRY